MRYDEGHRSDDLIDRRGERSYGTGGGGGGGLFLLLQLVPWLLRMRYGWVVLLLLGAGAYFSGMLGTSSNTRSVSGSSQLSAAQRNDPRVGFVSFVLDDAQATWERQLANGPKPYRHAKLVLFTDSIDTGCGYGQAATGPFYCPRDERVYIDLGFYDELAQRFGAAGDFAQAYVIAHEIGHHVQKILGSSEVGFGGPRPGASGSSVRIELQADCYAGIWAHFTEQEKLLEKGDLEEALRAATAIGDDRLQRMSQGTVHPESFTHGSSEQRSRWFRRGYDQGSITACDTFANDRL